MWTLIAVYCMSCQDRPTVVVPNLTRQSCIFAVQKIREARSITYDILVCVEQTKNTALKDLQVEKSK